VQVARDKLVALGVQLGRLTSHTGKFRLGIGAMDMLAQYAKYKVRTRSGRKGLHRCSASGCKLLSDLVTNGVCDDVAFTA
jgi:hypothetical protein